MTTTNQPQSRSSELAKTLESNATKPKVATVMDLISGDSMKKQFALAMPRHMTPDRFVRIAITAMRRTPELQKCSQESVLACLMTCSQYGLEPDGRRAHLIPFKKNKKLPDGSWDTTYECTLIVDYKGLAELALRSGLVSTLHADVVREGDLFEYSLGQITNHVPWFLRRDADRPLEQGECYAAYALCVNRDGTSKCEVMSVRELDGIRARSKSGNSGPWVTDEDEMRKKTAFRRLSKWLVLSPEFRDVADHDEDDLVIETTAVRRGSSAIGTAMVESLRLAEAATEDDRAATQDNAAHITEHRESDGDQPLNKSEKSAAFSEFLYDIQDAQSVKEADVMLAKLRGSKGATKHELSAAMAAFDDRITSISKPAAK